MIRTHIILFVISLIYAGDINYPEGWNELSSNENWELVSDKNRVQFYKKNISITSFPAYRIELETDIPIEILRDALWDLEIYKDLFKKSYTVEAETYELFDENHKSGYQIIDVPFIAPRLYQFDTYRFDDHIHWVKNYSNHTNSTEGMIIPDINFGSWEFVKQSGKTRIVYKLSNDPMGRIPKWIIEYANESYLPDMLLNVEKWVRENRVNKD